MTTNKITKCVCGANKFVLKEVLMHSGDINEEGSLDVFNIDNNIDTIVCLECDQEYSIDEFNSINFN